MDRPKKALKRLWLWSEGNMVPSAREDAKEVLAYLDWLEGKHVCEWPSELTLERLEYYAKCIEQWEEKIAIALRALAAIAPQKRKRVVNLWEWEYDKTAFGQEPKKTWIDDGAESPGRGWRKVAGPIELEE